MNKTVGSVLLSLLCLTISTPAQRSSYPFTAAKALTDVADASDFQFSMSGYNFTVVSSGRGLRSGGTSPTRSFNFRLDRNNYLTRVVYYADYERDLLLIYEVSDSDYGYGYIERLDGLTLKRKWRRAISGFNVGQGLIEDHHAYVTAIGFIGKVDLVTGFYVWRHQNLYERSKKAFNDFELPEVKGPLVIFSEGPSHLRKKVATIRVQRQNGKIVRLDF